jgi:hypothetical protein
MNNQRSQAIDGEAKAQTESDQIRFGPARSAVPHFIVAFMMTPAALNFCRQCRAKRDAADIAF